ncbi:hypothetical protein XPR_3079 [Xanthomonas arboricola pv. pruni MAFF 301420]|uniref:Uncharacterized protein n=1 Tax=Xanthomonas arboricola pv. pruni MAFF 301420 TaxID=1418095 RepID=W4SKG9_9XANT|nr:hypothetical protein XPR_3079 [Xanthomonas arboricola pv. pruni MAFF 301420]GAE60138.1 hypothetical protein XPN_2044 [Xanthomonas arboricola pv. pruni MAFF 301427]
MRSPARSAAAATAYSLWSCTKYEVAWAEPTQAGAHSSNRQARETGDRIGMLLDAGASVMAEGNSANWLVNQNDSPVGLY